VLKLNRAAAGAVLIVIQAAAIGLVVNALRPHPLPWVRIPLYKTHRMAESHEILGPIRTAPAVPGTTRSAQTPAPSAPKMGDKLSAAGTAKSSGAQANQSKAQSSGRPAPSEKRAEALFTTLPDAKALFDHKAAVFIDARHRRDYDLEHIPGALSVFVEDLDRLYDNVLGPIPKERTLVTYCSDAHCDASIRLADALVARGHKHVLILLEGLPGWKDAGYPTEKGDQK